MENPFSLSPNPRYFYLTALHRASVAKTNYVIDNCQGLATIMADVGHGKTTVLRYIYEQLRDRQDVRPHLLTHPQYPSEMQFLKAICLEFGLTNKRSKLEQLGELNEYLLKQHCMGYHVVLAIDEAQLLVGPQFELLRQLLNFETNNTKLITIILSGQPELRNKLRLKRSLSSRIAVNSTLDSLSPEDTRQMIHFRLHVSGYPESTFPNEVCKDVYQLTKGIPREIVKLCGIAFELAKMNKLDTVTSILVEQAKHNIML